MYPIINLEKENCQKNLARMMAIFDIDPRHSSQPPQQISKRIDISLSPSLIGLVNLAVINECNEISDEISTNKKKRYKENTFGLRRTADYPCVGGNGGLHWITNKQGIHQVKA